MATTTKSQLSQSQFTTPQEALTPIIGGGAQMVYEARWALHQIRSWQSESFGPTELLEIVEPLARAIGWAEALVFEQATDVTALSVAHGGQQGRS